MSCLFAVSLCFILKHILWHLAFNQKNNSLSVDNGNDCDKSLFSANIHSSDLGSKQEINRLTNLRSNIFILSLRLGVLTSMNLTEFSVAIYFKNRLWENYKEKQKQTQMRSILAHCMTRAIKSMWITLICFFI